MRENWRSLLFVPAHDHERLEAAYCSAADGVVADLEDGVPAELKAQARDVLADLIHSGPPGKRLVRVNQIDSDHIADDLALLAQLPVDVLVVPKATAAAIGDLGSPGPTIMAMVESAAGVREAYEIACCPGVSCLVLGAMDLSRDLDLQTRADSLEILYARSKIVVDSRAAGVGSPIDRVFPAVSDLENLRTDALLARAMGFAGKACTDPKHLAVLNDVFRVGLQRG
jgi:citrate lyase subunit beta/citryl-CoA lyase